MEPIAREDRERHKAGYRPVYPWLSPIARLELQRAAEARQKHPDRFAAELLERVLCDHLIDAVLDA